MTTSIYEKMRDAIGTNGAMRYVAIREFSDQYVVIDLKTKRVEEECLTEKTAEECAHQWNCIAFAKEAIKAKDAPVIQHCLQSKDEVLRNAFICAVSYAICQ